MIWRDPIYVDGKCPKCGSRVTMEPDCPGYPRRNPDGTETVMVCQPTTSCGNATLYECEHQDDEESDFCGWWFRTHNNRSTTNYHGIAIGPAPTEWEAKDQF